MAATFTSAEWSKILNLTTASAEQYGLPARRNKSVVLGTFNIRKLSDLTQRSPQARQFIELICKRFDLLHVQEVMDDLTGIRQLRDSLGADFKLVVSDVTGTFPGDAGNTERLAFLFNSKRIKHTELASDISYDRSKVIDTLFQNRDEFEATWVAYQQAMAEWEVKVAAAKAAGKRKPDKPDLTLPRFVTFIRQPHCASFEIVSAAGAKPIPFLAINAHLLYGGNSRERRWEFEALIEWLTRRAKFRDTMYCENMIMMGDCNLEFEDAGILRDDIDAFLKSLNSTVLKTKLAAKVNFPLLDPHPARGLLRSNAREDQTYDQIAIFAHDTRLPMHDQNATAGTTGPDGYDYGVFSFTNLFAQALYNKTFATLTKAQKDRIIDCCEFDVSDHMPAWLRLPIPV